LRAEGFNSRQKYRLRVREQYTFISNFGMFYIYQNPSLPNPDPHETDAESVLQILNVSNRFFREGATVHGIPKKSKKYKFLNYL